MIPRKWYGKEYSIIWLEFNGKIQKPGNLVPICALKNGRSWMVRECESLR